MLDRGKRNILGVLVDAVDYEAAVDRIVRAAQSSRPYAVTALAVHGVMTGVESVEHRHRLNKFDLITPDGMPVRWAINLLYRDKLPDRVYGPNLTRYVCDACESLGLPIYFYGSTQKVIDELKVNALKRWPGLKIAGAEPSKFRHTTPEEKSEIVERIKASGAKVTFVGLGCPRQEVFAYEYRNELRMPVLAVGAAFDYLAGNTREPSPMIQGIGLQWFVRLIQEPRRLWHRYLVLNPIFATRLLLQAFGAWHPDPRATRQPKLEMRYG
jgi:exopolysaccharide biosynthesis WecB/TagA/CpsF family protein